MLQMKNAKRAGFWSGIFMVGLFTIIPAPEGMNPSALWALASCSRMND